LLTHDEPLGNHTPHRNSTNFCCQFEIIARKNETTSQLDSWYRVESVQDEGDLHIGKVFGFNSWTHKWTLGRSRTSSICLESYGYDTGLAFSIC